MKKALLSIACSILCFAGASLYTSAGAYSLSPEFSDRFKMMHRECMEVKKQAIEDFGGSKGLVDCYNEMVRNLINFTYNYISKIDTPRNRSLAFAEIIGMVDSKKGWIISEKLKSSSHVPFIDVVKTVCGREKRPYIYVSSCPGIFPATYMKGIYCPGSEDIKADEGYDFGNSPYVV